MSSKHLRRMLEEQEKEKIEEPEVSEEEEVEDDIPAPVNRFAFLGGDDSGSEPDLESERESDAVPAEKKPPQQKKAAPARNTDKKKNKKKKKDVKRNLVSSDDNDDRLLEKLVLENKKIVGDETDDGVLELVEVEQLFKVDPRLFDPAAELKRALGRAFKESSSQNQPTHRNWKPAGRIVKQKITWPPVRNIGLSMVPQQREIFGRKASTNEGIQWFKFEHNGHYEKLERMCWFGEDNLDVNIAQEILHGDHWHLNSLLLLSNVLQMQEDITQATDCIERGIFYCEQSFHALFQPTSWKHRLDYTDYENRAFYLLLHKYMMICIHKRCFETALNVGKLIFSKDPHKDPLAMMLTFDTLAINAKQHRWLKNVYSSLKNWKNMDLLPGFRYSLALSKFLSAEKDDEVAEADELLAEAIACFPGVVTHLIDALQIQADSAIESHSHMSIFAFNRETEGAQLLVKIYVKQSSDLWKAPDTLLWLERVSRSVAGDSTTVQKMESWREKRQRIFVGIPQNVKRLGILLGLVSANNSVTDPEPPANGRQRYRRADHVASTSDQGVLAHFMQSLFPDYNPEETLGDLLGRFWNTYGPQNAPEGAGGGEQPPPPPAQQ